MQDRELVAAIVAVTPLGSPRRTTVTQRRYTPTAGSCCPTTIRWVTAASAVQDTFIVATAKLEGLRGGQAHTWLHAVAQRDRLRQLGADTGAGSATRLAGSDPG